MSLPETFNALLTEAECAQIDQTLLPTRDRFAIRLKIYAVRYLSEVAARLDTSVQTLTPEQIASQLQLDPNLQQDGSFEEPFADWFGNLLTASLSPLAQIASDAEVQIEQLSLDQIIDWHRRQTDLNLA